MTSQEIAEALNRLTRYDEVSHAWHTSISEEEWGDYVRVDELAKVFGLEVDGAFDEATGTSRGFKAKGGA